MTLIRIIARVLQSGRTTAKGVSPRHFSASPTPLHPHKHNRYGEHNKQTGGYGVSKLWVHVCLTGLLTFGITGVTYDCSTEDAADTPASSAESSSDSAATMPHTESLQTSTLPNFEETKDENGIIATVKGNKEIEFIEDVDFTPEEVDALVTTCQIAFDPTLTDLEKTARREKLRLEALLRSKGGHDGSYPPYTVGVKGQKEVEITKKGSFTAADLDVVEMALKIAGENVFELLCKLLGIEVKVNW